MFSSDLMGHIHTKQARKHTKNLSTLLTQVLALPSPSNIHTVQLCTVIQKGCFDAKERQGGKKLFLLYYMHKLIKYYFPGQGPCV